VLTQHACLVSKTTHSTATEKIGASELKIREAYAPATCSVLVNQNLPGSSCLLSFMAFRQLDFILSDKNQLETPQFSNNIGIILSKERFTALKHVLDSDI
jgi:hypothetical protein